jgi:hypothetical protein
MIVNENGWGDKKAPVTKEDNAEKLKKAKLQKDAPVEEVVVEDAEQE